MFLHRGKISTHNFQLAKSVPNVSIKLIKLLFAFDQIILHGEMHKEKTRGNIILWMDNYKLKWEERSCSFTCTIYVWTLFAHSSLTINYVVHLNITISLTFKLEIYDLTLCHSIIHCHWLPSKLVHILIIIITKPRLLLPSSSWHI